VAMGAAINMKEAHITTIVFLAIMLHKVGFVLLLIYFVIKKTGNYSKKSISDIVKIFV
jgi:hypothetical protein